MSFLSIWMCAELQQKWNKVLADKLLDEEIDCEVTEFW